ncbi:MAG TPA: heavy metal translocating P-type ATPase [Candidatus Aminicenantes bacterium]|nr:heavy metal translocating P-type ATPase [Candidatus Aminicenantes bacterium]
MSEKDSTATNESRLSFGIRGMTCATCARRIEQRLSKTPGVDFVSINLATERGFVTGSPALTLEKVGQSVREAGYNIDTEPPGQDVADRHFRRARANLFRALLITLPVTLLMILHMSGIHVRGIPWIEVVSGILLWAFPGRGTLRSAWIALVHRHTNMDSLVVMGSAAAWATGLMNGLGAPVLSFGSLATMLPALHLSGRYVESRLRRRAASAIHGLLALQPDEVDLIHESGTIRVPSESVKPESLIRVRSGERIPLDGTVANGRGLVDEAMVSGEPTPVPKNEGDAVISGTILQSGSLEIVVTHVGADTFLSRMIRLVEEAQSSKVPIQALADRITLVFIPVVTACALAAGAAWFWAYPHLQPLLQRAASWLPWVVWDAGAASTAIFAVVATLVVACPCALGLATPMALTTGSGAAAQRGLIIRNGEAIQMSQEMDALLLDKTGTLTQGHPRVVENTLSPEMVGVAAALEHHSIHPLAEAVVRYAESIHAPIPSRVEQIRETAGQGISGRVNGNRFYLGRPEKSGDYPHWLRAGYTVVELRRDEHAMGGLATADTLREDSAVSVARFRKEGIRVIMVTGDHEAAARAVAKAAGIDEVFAGLTPEEKVEIVHRLQRKGLQVGMVGDGLNDAAALKTADVGIAVGEGTDLAMESADMVIVRGGLSRVADAVDISRITFRAIRRNLFWAFFYNLLAIPLAMAALLHPLVAEAAMFFSSANVVLNASRVPGKVKQRLSE